RVKLLRYRKTGSVPMAIEARKLRLRSKRAHRAIDTCQNLTEILAKGPGIDVRREIDLPARTESAPGNPDEIGGARPGDRRRYCQSCQTAQSNQHLAPCRHDPRSRNRR